MGSSLRFTHSFPIAWGELDAFGHVNNVAFFRYMESTRMFYLERIGVLTLHREHNIGVILAATHCDFERPLAWPATITVHAGTSKLGNTSFTMDYRIHDEQGTLVATGSSVQVMYDYSKAGKVPVPQAIRDSIAHIEGWP